MVKQQLRVAEAVVDADLLARAPRARRCTAALPRPINRPQRDEAKHVRGGIKGVRFPCVRGVVEEIKGWRHRFVHNILALHGDEAAPYHAQRPDVRL
jgi:hypothetical protein